MSQSTPPPSSSSDFQLDSFFQRLVPFFEQINSRLDTIESNVDAIKTDLQRAQSDIAEVKTVTQKTQQTIKTLSLKVGATFEIAARNTAEKKFGRDYSRHFEILNLYGLARLSRPKLQYEPDMPNKSTSQLLDDVRLLLTTIYSKRLYYVLLERFCLTAEHLLSSSSGSSALSSLDPSILKNLSPISASDFFKNGDVDARFKTVTNQLRTVFHGANLDKLCEFVQLLIKFRQKEQQLQREPNPATKNGYKNDQLKFVSESQFGLLCISCLVDPKILDAKDKGIFFQARLELDCRGVVKHLHLPSATSNSLTVSSSSSVPSSSPNGFLISLGEIKSGGASYAHRQLLRNVHILVQAFESIHPRCECLFDCHVFVTSHEISKRKAITETFGSHTFRINYLLV